jgi:hypothetical protein
VLISVDNVGEGWKMASLAVMLLCGFGSFFMGILMCVLHRNPENKAEEELKLQWHKAAAGPSGTN